MFDWLWPQLPGPMQTQVEGFVAGFWATLPQLFAAFVFIVFGWGFITLVSATVPRGLLRTGLRPSLVNVFAMLLKVGLWLGVILIAITIAFPTVTPGRAVAALGLGGVAVGFAFKDVFENFLAGILLLIREPFEVRDFIECEGIDGQVEEITIRDTHIRQTDGQRVVAPNAMFFKNPVTIRTTGDLRRTTIICGVAYKEDVDQAREVIARAVRKVDSVRNDVKDIQIFAQAFGSSSIDFEVTWWTGSRPVDIRASRDKVVAAVKRALDDAGIEIPFPYRTLTFDEPMSMRRLRDEADMAADTERPTLTLADRDRS